MDARIEIGITATHPACKLAYIDAFVLICATIKLVYRRKFSECQGDLRMFKGDGRCFKRCEFSPIDNRLEIRRLESHLAQLSSPIYNNELVREIFIDRSRKSALLAETRKLFRD